MEQNEHLSYVSIVLSSTISLIIQNKFFIIDQKPEQQLKTRYGFVFPNSIKKGEEGEYIQNRSVTR